MTNKMLSANFESRSQILTEASVLKKIGNISPKRSVPNFQKDPLLPTPHLSETSRKFSASNNSQQQNDYLKSKKINDYMIDPHSTQFSTESNTKSDFQRCENNFHDAKNHLTDPRINLSAHRKQEKSDIFLKCVNWFQNNNDTSKCILPLPDVDPLDPRIISLDSSSKTIKNAHLNRRTSCETSEASSNNLCAQSETTTISIRNSNILNRRHSIETSEFLNSNQLNPRDPRFKYSNIFKRLNPEINKSSNNSTNENSLEALHAPKDETLNIGRSSSLKSSQFNKSTRVAENIASNDQLMPTNNFTSTEKNDNHHSSSDMELSECEDSYHNIQSKNGAIDTLFSEINQSNYEHNLNSNIKETSSPLNEEGGLNITTHTCISESPQFKVQCLPTSIERACTFSDTMGKSCSATKSCKTNSISKYENVYKVVLSSDDSSPVSNETSLKRKKIFPNVSTYSKRKLKNSHQYENHLIDNYDNLYSKQNNSILTKSPNCQTYKNDNYKNDKHFLKSAVLNHKQFDNHKPSGSPSSSSDYSEEEYDSIAYEESYSKKHSSKHDYDQRHSRDFCKSISIKGSKQDAKYLCDSPTKKSTCLVKRTYVPEKIVNPHSLYIEIIKNQKSSEISKQNKYKSKIHQFEDDTKTEFSEYQSQSGEYMDFDSGEKLNPKSRKRYKENHKQVPSKQIQYLRKLYRKYHKLNLLKKLYQTEIVNEEINILLKCKQKELQNVTSNTSLCLGKFNCGNQWLNIKKPLGKWKNIIKFLFKSSSARINCSLTIPKNRKLASHIIDPNKWVINATKVNKILSFCDISLCKASIILNYNNKFLENAYFEQSCSEIFKQERHKKLTDSEKITETKSSATSSSIKTLQIPSETKTGCHIFSSCLSNKDVPIPFVENSNLISKSLHLNEEPLKSNQKEIDSSVFSWEAFSLEHSNLISLKNEQTVYVLNEVQFNALPANQNNSQHSSNSSKLTENAMVQSMSANINQSKQESNSEIIPPNNNFENLVHELNVSSMSTQDPIVPGFTSFSCDNLNQQAELAQLPSSSKTAYENNTQHHDSKIFSCYNLDRQSLKDNQAVVIQSQSYYELPSESSVCDKACQTLSHPEMNFNVFKSECGDKLEKEKIDCVDFETLQNMDIFKENGIFDSYLKHVNGLQPHFVDLSAIEKKETELSDNSNEVFDFLLDKVSYHKSVVEGLVSKASEPGSPASVQLYKDITHHMEHVEGYELACKLSKLF